MAMNAERLMSRHPLNNGLTMEFWDYSRPIAGDRRFVLLEVRIAIPIRPDPLAPEWWSAKIFEISGTKFKPDAAADLWPKILQHKSLLSEKLGRDVGLRVSCIDFLENMEQAREEYLAYQRRDILNEMGAQTISKELWDTISESQPPNHARYIYGLTATPTRRDGHHPIIFMYCGPVRYRADARKEAEKRPFEHYVIPRRALQMLPHLKAALANGIAVVVVTRPT